MIRDDWNKERYHTRDLLYLNSFPVNPVYSSSDWIPDYKPKDNEITLPINAADIYVNDNTRLDTFLNNINGGIISPEMYGAIGDGIHDDAPALQAAMQSGKPVALTQNLYLFSQILVTNKDVFLDGQGFTLYMDGAAFQNNNQLTHFINLYCPFDDTDETCEMTMVTDTTDIVVAENGIYHKGYVSYLGDNPTPGQETYDNSEIHHWHAHSATIKNLNCECKNVDSTIILYIDRYCHGLLQNLRLCTINGEDGGSGINIWGCYDFNITQCFVSGFASLHTGDAIHHSLGAGLTASGTNITISDCVLRNCRAELSLGSSRRYFDCGVVVNNVVLERNPGYTLDRLFDIHAAIYNPMISNITINNNTDLNEGFYAILWRCPKVYAQNICIQSNAGMTGLFFGELAEEIIINGLYAENCDLRTDNATNMLKTIEINTGIIRRLLACNSTSTLIRMRNVTIRDIAHDVRNGWFENCRFRHEISWSKPTIIATASLTLIDCEIEGEHTYWYPTTPLIQAPRNSVTMKNCKLYTMPNNARKIFNTTQTDVSGNYEEDIAGIRLGTDRAILGVNNLF